MSSDLMMQMPSFPFQAHQHLLHIIIIITSKKLF
jgi:hypothetical protein